MGISDLFPKLSLLNYHSYHLNIFMPYWFKRRELKILLLQLRKRRSLLHISLKGSLGGKRQRGAKELAEDLRAQIASSVTQFAWKHVPRARMAVTMTFFPHGNQSPALHNLVKFYLDELRSLVFKDDRQVSYLAAESWQPLRSSEKHSGRESSVHIEVERLADGAVLYCFGCSSLLQPFGIYLLPIISLISTFCQ
jgi:hypothetical protein